MLKEVFYFDKKSVTLNEARKNNAGLPLNLEILKFLLIILFLEGILPILFHSSLNYLINSNDSNILVLTRLSVDIIVLVIDLAVLLFVEKRSLRSIGFTRNNIIKSYIGGLLCGLIMFGGVVFIGVLLGQYSFDAFDLSSLIWAFPFFFAFVFQGLHEEVFNRGWMLVSMSRKNPISVVLLINAIIFMCLHLGGNGVNVIALINMALGAIIFSLMFLRFDNIWFCSAVHTMWNYMQGYLMGFTVSGISSISSLFKFHILSYSIVGGNSFGPEAGLITTVVMILTIVFLLKVYNKN